MRLIVPAGLPGFGRTRGSGNLGGQKPKKRQLAGAGVR